MIHFLFFISSFLSSNYSLGFVENVSHGYVNCMACHFSPSGGGLLNDYGRTLPKELMSTWGWSNSEKPLFGAISNNEWFKVGGDYRYIQTYLEDENVKQGKQFEMQKNLELGLNFSRVWFIGALGTQEGPQMTPKKGQFLSENHYLLWDVTDEIKLRAGKFRLNYGLNDPNHTRVTKESLGFGSNSESYILEFSKFSESYEIFISADLGRLDLPRNLKKEKSISLNYAVYTSEKSKVGANFLLGESASLRRNLFGLYGVGRILENFIVKAEANYQQSNATVQPEVNKYLISNLISLGYRATKGLVPYAIGEHLQQDLNDKKSQKSSAGLGLQWLPIPHLEFQMEYTKQFNNALQTKPIDKGFLLFHFYL